MILQKKGYPPVDVELSKKLTPPSGLIAFLKTKGLKATHKNRDFYEIGKDFVTDEILQPRKYLDPTRYESLAWDYTKKGWDHYEFPSVVVVNVKDRNWKLPKQAGGFHSVMGAFPINSWTHAWTDELEVDSMLDAMELSAILNHPRHSQIKGNTISDIVETIYECICQQYLPPFDFTKKAENLKIRQSINRSAGDMSQDSRERIFNKGADELRKVD